MIHYYRLFLINPYIINIRPIFIDISAILNTGKFIKFKLIKSITYPFEILSTPLPTVPAKMKLPKGQQERDMLARELLIKFQMSSNHPLVALKKTYVKGDNFKLKE